MSNSPKESFTLIELLVVIAIIAILAGMLLPALNNARDSARSADCTGKLKQIASAALQYSGDNRDFAIPLHGKIGAWHGELMIGTYLGAWTFDKNKNANPNGGKMFFCEADRTPKDKRKNNVNEYAMMWEAGLPMSYGLNRLISKHYSWVGIDAIGYKINRMKQPSGSYMGGDSIGWAACQNTSVGSEYATFIGDGSWHYWRINFRHNGQRTNAMWWDGHVSPFRYIDIADKSNPNTGSSSDMKYVTFWKGY